VAKLKKKDKERGREVLAVEEGRETFKDRNNLQAVVF
jgi:hypothetical protein